MRISPGSSRSRRTGSAPGRAPCMWRVGLPAGGRPWPPGAAPAVPPRSGRGLRVGARGRAPRLAEWRRVTPAVSTPDERLTAMLAVSTEDLGALRIFDGDRPDRNVVAAGAPWFMTLFGRDALLTSWMLLPLDHTLALGTLHTLARLQGTK